MFNVNTNRRNTNRVPRPPMEDELEGEQQAGVGSELREGGGRSEARWSEEPASADLELGFSSA